MRNSMLRFLLCVATGWVAISLPSIASAQSGECTTTVVNPADFGLSIELAGAEASLSSCDDGDYLAAQLDLGANARVSVSGRLDLDVPCLRSNFEEDIWPGFLADDQVVSICRAEDGSWSASMDASAYLQGSRVGVKGATFELDSASPSFAIETLELGPFSLEDVSIGTAGDGGLTVAASLSATLPLSLPGGGSLTMSGELGPDSAGLSLELASLPSDFPFPGITIPSTSATLGFRHDAWNLEFAFAGTTELGPLGELPVDAGSLSVQIDDSGEWALAGCLSSAPVEQSLDVLELSALEVDICAASGGDASVAWTAVAELSSLGLGPAAVSGSLAHSGGVYSGTAAFIGPVPAGALGTLDLDGELTVSGGNGSADLSGCLRTSASSMVVGGLSAELSFAVGDTCEAGSAFDVSFAGTVQIANQAVSATGKVAISDAAWSSQATLANVSLGIYQLEQATLALDSAGSASLEADLSVGAFELTVAGRVASSGAFSLSVGLRSSVDLGNGVIISDVAGSRLAYDGTTWRLFLAIGGSATVAGNTVDARGRVDVSYDQAAGEWQIDGCIEASGLPARRPLRLNSAELCFTDGTPSLRVSGSLELPSGSVRVAGSYAPDPDTGQSVLTLEVLSADGKLTLAAGIEIERVQLTLTPTTTALDLVAELCLGGLCMDVTGVYNPDGASYLQLGLDVLAWQPFPGTGLPALTGTINGQILLAADGGGSVSYQLATAQNFNLTANASPGLTLTNVFVAGSIDSGGEWKLELGGDTEIVFGEYDFELTLRGAVDSSGTWELSGASTISFEPLEGLVGAGVFVVRNPVFAVTASAGALDIELAAQLAIDIIPDRDPIAATVRAGVIAGSDAGLWFVCDIDGLTVPLQLEDPDQVWELPTLTLVATTTKLVDFDLFGTPGDESDDLSIEAGITLTTVATLPIRLDEPADPDHPEVGQPEARLSLYVGDAGLEISGLLEVDLTLITEDHRIPTISSVTFNSFEIDGKISTSGKLSLGFAATSSFTPSNSTESLLANVRIEVGYQAPRLIFGGQLSIAGRWIEPFGLPRIAMQDPAFKLGFAVTTSWPPAPMLNAIGVNGDALWLKSGDWPDGFGDTAVPAPSNIVHAGASFYLELDLTPSGICIGACLPLPPLIARVELHNLAARELAAAANGIKDALREIVLAAAPEQYATQLAQAIPDGDFAELALGPVDGSDGEAPFDISIKDASIYLSTHNIEPWPGIRFQAGVHADLDVTVGTHHTEMHGQLSTDGLLLEGRIDPISIGSFVLTGDPFAKVADLSSSGSAYVRVPSTSQLEFSTGTVEGWVRGGASKRGNLLQRAYGPAQIQVGMSGLESVCTDDGQCVSRARARVYLRDATSSQTLLSEPIMVPDQWHHLALVIEDEELRLILDGSVVASAARTARPLLRGTTYLGYGLSSIDEVRLWKIPRSAADIAAYATRLSPGSGRSGALLARYSFDFDDGADAYNSRPVAGSVHGRYVRAAAAFDSRDQQPLFQLQLLLSGLGDSGAIFRGGVSLDPTGQGTPIAFATELTARLGEVAGSLYAPSVELLEMPGLGTIALRGAGPNLLSGDFDDGVYAAFDLMAGDFTAEGQLEFSDESGASSTVGAVSVQYLCPAGSVCPDPSSHQLQASGSVDLSAELGALGTFGLSGSASYSSVTARLEVAGTVTAFGQSMASGSIRVDREGISLRADVDLGAGVGLDLGSMSMSLDYQYAPARLCGSGTGPIAVPGIPETIDASATACFGSSPSLSLTGSARRITLAGIPVRNATVGYSSSLGISIAGDVSVAGVFSGRMSGYYQSPTSFSLTATSTVTLGGFTMSSASVTLGPAGISATGRLNLAILSVDATVAFDKDGSFTSSGSGTASLAGFQAPISYTLSERGLSVTGAVNVLGNSWSFAGSVHSDGAFVFEGNQALTLQGFTMANASVSLAKYTAKHRRRYREPKAGLRVGGTLSLPYGNGAALSFAVAPNGSFSASTATAITLKGWPLANSRVAFNQDRLTVTGDVSVPGGSLSVDTRLYSNGYFSATASSSLEMGGFELSSTSLSLSSSSGLRLSGRVRIGSSTHRISGDISGLSVWELCTSSSSVSPSMSSWLPSIRGQFCLEKTLYSSPRLRGEGRATYLGKSFDTEFRISTTGGLEYLYIRESPKEFTLLGAKATGSVRIYVRNNSLKSFRWYGSLKVPNGLGGSLIDFNSSVALSAYQLCPTHFGLPAPPRGAPTGCVSLFF